MKSCGTVLYIIIFTFALFSCQGKNSLENVSRVQGDSLFFKIEQLQPNNGADKWRAEYTKKNITGAFEFEVDMGKFKPGEQVSFSKGKLFRVAGSDNSEFLSDLSRVLRAVKPTIKTEKKNELEFSCAILGVNLSREGGEDVIAGSFTSSKPGDWIALKMFVADGIGEFYMNLNPKKNIGEISIKDPDLGDIVMAELAAIL